jgi:ribonucleotide reductase alpha subunit
MSTATEQITADIVIESEAAQKANSIGLNAQRVVSKRYSLKDAQGNPIEEWADIVRRVVGHVSTAERSPEKRDEFFSAMKQIMLDRSLFRTRLVLSTPEKSTVSLPLVSC